MKARPFAGTNAIDAAVFTVELQQPPSPGAVHAIKTILDEFRADLPGEQSGPPNGFFVAMGSAMPPFGDVLRFAAKPSGDHAWRVQLTGPVLQVLCGEYTRFADVWGKARLYLKAMLLALSKSEPSARVVSITHQYVDKFLYPPEMQLEQYAMEELFQRSTPFLTSHAWSSGLQWHVYQGWFADPTSERRILQQLNLSNVEFSSPVVQLGCLIDHRCTHQRKITELLEPAALANSNADLLNSIVTELHNLHKVMLKQLLQPAKLEEIGMVN